MPDHRARSSAKVQFLFLSNVMAALLQAHARLQWCCTGHIHQHTNQHTVQSAHNSMHHCQDKLDQLL